jgi:site-specific recombinase XerD
VPYIYSRDELRRLLDAATVCENPRSKLQPHTCRMLILLLYGAGLRISEALALTLADVDLADAILTIRESKFYKTRLVSIGPDLTGAVAAYAARRSTDYSADPEAPFFVSRTGTPLKRRTAENIFRRLCARAGVKRDDGCRSAQASRLAPRLCGASRGYVVPARRQCATLPQLATYLGHLHIAATSAI